MSVSVSSGCFFSSSPRIYFPNINIKISSARIYFPNINIKISSASSGKTVEVTVDPGASMFSRGTSNSVDRGAGM